MITGITVVLHERPQDWLWSPFSFEDGDTTATAGAATTDTLNRTSYSENTVYVSNVLVSPASEAEVTDTLTLYGRKAIYTLGIPKGDHHVWTGGTVEFFGRTWAVIGDAQEGIEANMTLLPWGKKIRVGAVNEQ